jgi:hypothetical protein
MRKILLAGAFSLALGCSLRAQVTVEVRLDQDQFLQGETLPVAVRIVNRSGQTLHLGEDADWLTFSIESKDQFIVSKNAEAPVTGAFDLESSKFATKRVDLAPYFNLNKSGHYEISATVRIKNWDAQMSSPGKGFDLIEGTRLWEQAFGVPTAGTNATQAPEIRKYILQQANYLRSQIRLYVRLTDESESRVIRVLPIGPAVSLNRPEPQVDRQSNLHLLNQNGARTFNYTVVNPDGNVLAHQTYEYLNSRPRLKLDADGKIIVFGGVRRPMLDDVPAPKISTEEPKPPQTSQP